MFFRNTGGFQDFFTKIFAPISAKLAFQKLIENIFLFNESKIYLKKSFRNQTPQARQRNSHYALLKPLLGFNINSQLASSISRAVGLGPKKIALSTSQNPLRFPYNQAWQVSSSVAVVLPRKWKIPLGRSQIPQNRKKKLLTTHFSKFSSISMKSQGICQSPSMPLGLHPFQMGYGW